MSIDFLGLLIRLAKAEVKFVVIGGFAGVVYGCTFVTQDVDICCDFSVDNLLRLQNAVSQLHPTHRMNSKKVVLRLTQENCKDYKNLSLDTDIGQLDCLGFVDGVGDYQAVEAASRKIEVEGVELKVLQIESLIKAKKALNRLHDKEAILQLEALKKRHDPK